MGSSLVNIAHFPKLNRADFDRDAVRIQQARAPGSDAATRDASALSWLAAATILRRIAP